MCVKMITALSGGEKNKVCPGETLIAVSFVYYKSGLWMDFIENL